MYKILILLITSAGCIITLSAQKLKESKVPSIVRSAFQKKYPDSRAKWEKEKGSYEVSFTKGGKTMSAVINKAGIILETETDIAVNELPRSILSYRKTHYKVTEIKEAAKICKSKW